MALGDKVYNYDFYGYPNNRIWDTPNDIGVPIATLTEKNIATYYTIFQYIGGIPLAIGIQPDYNGKVFDESISLWKIAADATFASKSMFYCSSGNSLSFETKTTDNFTNAKAAIAAIDTDSNSQYSGFWREPIKRFAYDISNDVGLGYGSAFISDIIYNNFCIYPRAYVSRLDGQVSPQSLSTLKNYIDGNPAIRDVSLIRSEIYRGTTLPRTKNNHEVPLDAVAYTSLPRKCSPILDTLNASPIADMATAIKNYITYNSEDPTSPFAYNTNETYAPFMYQIAAGLFGTESISLDRMHDIGIFINRTVSSWKAGLTTIPNSGGTKASVYYFRFNTKNKIFDDVEYHWSIHMRYLEGGYDLNNGTDISNLNNSHNITLWTKLELDDYKDAATKGEASLRAVLHEIAYLGMYFTDTEEKAQNINFLTGNLTGIYCPIFDENGATTGLYKTGEEIKDLPNWNADSVAGETFNPPSSSSADEVFNTIIPTEVLGLPRFARTYLCGISDIEFLNLNLKSFDWSEENYVELFYNQDPYEFIISATAYPLVYYPLPPAATRDDIWLGKVNMNTLPDKFGDCTGYPIMGGVIQYFDPFGDMYVTPKYSNKQYDLAFLDYEPYTKLFLYLPYAEMVSIPPSVFMGKTISIDLSVDFLSGNIIYYIFVSDSTGRKEYTTARGNIATEIPISGYDYSAYKELTAETHMASINNFMNGLNATLGHVAGASVSTTFKNETGANLQKAMAVTTGLQTTMNIAYDEAKLAYTAPSSVTISNGNAAIGVGNMQDAYLYILRPMLPGNFDTKKFAKVMGKASAYVDKLGNCSGLTLMTNPILDDIDCTAEEKQMIIDALSNGVIM